MPLPVIIHTGNLLEVSELKRKPGHTPADELFDSLSILVKTKAPEIHCKIKQGVVSNGLPRKLDPAERMNQKITAKVFLTNVNEDVIHKALSYVLRELEISQVDLLLVSWPRDLDPFTDGGEKLWSQVEESVKNGRVLSVGLSDMDTQQFISLFSKSEVKPEAVQVNLEVCCVVPPELATFARENNIQLLTHNDPQDILTSEKLNDLDSSFVGLNWVVRYQTLWRCRGILENKGYIIEAVADV